MWLPLYRMGTALCAPLIARRDRMRAVQKGVPFERLSERSGHPSAPRPDGHLVWVNAVSVGETLSALRMIDGLVEDGVHVVLTTTTATAAQAAAPKLPDGAIHQYAPLDTPGPVARFLSHWEPNLAVCVESDLWPRQILTARSRGIPLALVNARLSDGSLRMWSRAPRTARKILGAFDRIYAQTDRVGTALARLSGLPDRVEVTGDLKASAAPLSVDAVRLRVLRDQIGDRPVWGALSTHPGEETRAAQAHAAMPDGALLIMAPRHPDRGDAIARDLRARGLCVAQRSAGDPITAQTQVYLADTLGEMGLWFTLSDVAFIGASLFPIGGHNPYEAIDFGTPVVVGPHRANFADAYRRMDRHGAVRLLPDADAATLGDMIAQMMQPDANAAASAAMASFPKGAEDLPQQIAADLLDLIPGYRST